jgi:hypothetical protein
MYCSGMGLLFCFCVGHAKGVNWVGSPISRTVGFGWVVLFAVFGSEHNGWRWGLVINYMSSSLGSGFGALGKWIL